MHTEKVARTLRHLLQDCQARGAGACRFFCEEPLSRFCTFRVGGPAAIVLLPQNKGQLCACLCGLYHRAIPFRLLGNGSNVLPRDERYAGVVVCTRACQEMYLHGTCLTAACGTDLRALIRYAVDAGAGGLEGLYGIPATLGGAIYMNAGAHGATVSDYLQTVELLDLRTRRVSVCPASALQFSYRHSCLMQERELVVLSATFCLPRQEAGVLRASMREVIRQRAAAQPLSLPSAGSVFRATPAGPAWRLIDACGLRGCQIGGAQIAVRHAGFIVGRGNTHAAEVRALVHLAQERVYAQMGIALVPEIEMW